MRRNQMEMYADILEAVVYKLQNRAKLTHIMYKANVNCSVLKESVDYLIKIGLLTEETIGTRTTYSVTEDGRVFLKHYYNVRKMLKLETQ